MAADDEIINAFFGDTEVQRLLQLTSTWQPLQICYPKEVHVSRFLAWLLDPSQGHGLGTLAMRALLIAAGREGFYDACDVDIRTRRYLAPSSVMTESFTPSLITTEIDVKEKDRQLDVLCVDISHSVYVAIENKFGARESEDQLASYRKGLQKMFPDHLGVHIFLDTKKAEPSDKAWLAPGYTWLIDFLRECEQRKSTAEDIRQALGQFRQALQEEDDDLAPASPVGNLVTSVAANHAEALALMRPWSRLAKGKHPDKLAELLGEAGNNAGKARLRLFQLYCQRQSVWQKCLKGVEFAGFEKEMRNEFSSVYSDTKQVQTFYSLPEWERFVDPDDAGSWYYPVCIRVRKMDEHFRVVSFVQLSSVKEGKREHLVEIAKRLQKINGLPGRKIDDPSHVTVKRVDNLTLEQAKSEAISQMRVLQREFLQAL